MDKKKVILIVAALFVAAIAAFLARSMFSGAPAPQAQAAKVVEVSGKQVLVANRSMPVGTIVAQDSFSFQPWPEDLVEEAYFLKETADPTSLFGTVVRHDITAGQPVTQGTLVSPGDRGFLAAALAPGMRAVTVPVSALTGVAGFVFPGDRIDLVLTQQIAGSDGPPLKVSETIMQNLRVLATDQRVSPTTNEAGQTVAQTTNLVTFETTPKLAEKIAVSQTLGTLSLSLRSIADNQAELERALAAGDIEAPESDDPAEEARMLAKLATRPVATKSTFSTGGDVSRFQRRSVPVIGGEGSDKAGASAAEPTAPTGPTVRIARGNTVTEVKIEGK